MKFDPPVISLQAGREWKEGGRSGGGMGRYCLIFDI
tara:strand:+ start:255 stop:362 length:108 start_codon:yes stop_codon:yes gene_type:complete